MVASTGVSVGGAGRRGAFLLTHGRAFEVDAIAVVHESVEAGVGKCWLIDVGMSLLDRQLAGDERGFLVVTILRYLQPIALGLVGERWQAEVVDVQ